MSTTARDFTLHTPDTACADAKPILDAAQKSFGMVPNLHAVLAEAPVALEGYGTLMSIFERSSLSGPEQQLVLLTTSFENECRYCMAGHSMLAANAGLAKDAIDAIRDGNDIDDEKLEALHRFTSSVVRMRGQVGEGDVNAFVDAGYSKQAALEVIVGVAVKTISNYTDHVAEVPLDGFMKKFEWFPPSTQADASKMADA